MDAFLASSSFIAYYLLLYLCSCHMHFVRVGTFLQNILPFFDLAIMEILTQDLAAIFAQTIWAGKVKI